MKATDGKRKVSLKGFDTFYLPQIQEFFELLKLPSTIPQLMSLVEQQTGFKAKIGRSSLYDLTTLGVGPRVWRKLKSFGMLTLPDLDFSRSSLRYVRRSFRVGSNAGSWFSFVTGAGAGANIGEEWDLLLGFIKHRMESDLSFSEVKSEYRKRKKGQGVEAPAAQEVLTFLSPFLSSNTLLPQKLLDCMVSIPDKPQKELEQSEIDLCACFFTHLHADFYLSALAHYSVGKSLYAIQSYGDLPRVSTHAEIIQYAKDNDEMFLAGWLNLLRHRLAEDEDESISWRALSESIPIKEVGDDASGNSLKDKQYDRIKGWRKGNPKDRPGDDVLKGFLQNLGCDEFNTTYYFESVKVVMAMDALRVQWLSSVTRSSDATIEEPFGCSADTAKVIVTEIFDHYQVHWQHCADKFWPEPKAM